MKVCLQLAISYSESRPTWSETFIDVNGGSSVFAFEYVGNEMCVSPQYQFSLDLVCVTNYFSVTTYTNTLILNIISLRLQDKITQPIFRNTWQEMTLNKELKVHNYLEQKY